MNSMYACSDGRYYTERDRRRNFESGWWSLRVRDTETGVEVVTDPYDVVLRLEPLCGPAVSESGRQTREYTLG